jgi:phosphotriesterase-related protein
MAVTINALDRSISADELGVTLMHEHTLRLPRRLNYDGVRSFSKRIQRAPVTASNAHLVREDPYVSWDNRELAEVDLLVEELGKFRDRGGRTIVDNTNGPERTLDLVHEVAHRSGLTIVAGSGWSPYIGDASATASIDPVRVAAEISREFTSGIPLNDGTVVRPGVIGEIEVGQEFTPRQRAILVGCAYAQMELGVPLLVHLPAWQRRGLEVVDVLRGTGIDLGSVVLCHIDPSGADREYIDALIATGVWVEFDMIGMLNYYPGEGQSPSAGFTAENVARIIHEGHASRILLSQDVGMKTMWTRFGGNGYGYILDCFIPRLVELGVSDETAQSIMTSNPREVFTTAAR